jgi:hypothetical protein
MIFNKSSSRGAAEGGVSKDAPDVSGAPWSILRDGRCRDLIRMRAEDRTDPGSMKA